VIVCADARPESRCGPQTQPVYAMLVRLLWCCGLRIGEALSLRVGDVDLAEALITVHKAKHNRTRLVPMSQSLAAHARRYAAAVGLVPEEPEAWYFPSPRGGLQPRVGHRAYPGVDARSGRHHGRGRRSPRP
jgi:integrase